MLNTTNRTRSRTERRVRITHVSWPFGLHRQAAAAAIGAVCVFALQMRNRPTPFGFGGVCGLPITGSGLGDAERREESP